ncbi:hypothetical protein M885DRAFT_413959, partial [Pelagophyceae sp. CCMP2097]
PDYAEAWNLRAKAHFVRGDFAACVADAERAVTLQPRHFSAWAGKALALTQIGDYAAAIAAFEHATQINP